METRSSLTANCCRNRFYAVGLLAACFLLLPVSAFANSAPVVSNVSANQRGDDSKLVDIRYDLADADGDSCTVWVVVSDNGGATWSVPAFTFAGHIGHGVFPGVNRHVIWDAGHDLVGISSIFKARVFADDGHGPSMVPVPASYYPGSQTYLPAFFIDTYEVTNLRYCEFLNSIDPNPAYWNSSLEITRTSTTERYYYTVIPGREEYPVRYVSLYDAEAFAAWRSSQDGLTYRLPTEQEWEKAAGWDPVEQHSYIYGCHSDTIDCTWCNYAGCGGGPTPVGYYNGTGGRKDAKSYYGCYDMSGNLWEWTSSYSGSDRVLRGGAWSDAASRCRVADRIYHTPSTRTNHFGFRLVLDLE